MREIDSLLVIGYALGHYQAVQQAYREAEAELHYRDMEANDLNHALELNIFNAAEGYRLAKQLQENRIARRNAKDRLEELDSLHKLMKRHNHFFAELKKVQKEVEVTLERRKKRNYKPRVRDDLFEKVM